MTSAGASALTTKVAVSGDRSDAGQGLAPEPQRLDAFQIARASYFARRVPLECEPGVLGDHAQSIVNDGDRSDSAPLNPDVDARCLRVECVLDELLDDGGWSFDHLSCRYAIGQLFG